MAGQTNASPHGPQDTDPGTPTPRWTFAPPWILWLSLVMTGLSLILPPLVYARVASSVIHDTITFPPPDPLSALFAPYAAEAPGPHPRLDLFITRLRTDPETAGWVLTPQPVAIVTIVCLAVLGILKARRQRPVPPTSWPRELWMPAVALGCWTPAAGRVMLGTLLGPFDPYRQQMGPLADSILNMFVADATASYSGEVGTLFLTALICTIGTAIALRAIRRSHKALP